LHAAVEDQLDLVCPAAHRASGSPLRRREPSESRSSGYASSRHECARRWKGFVPRAPHADRLRAHRDALACGARRVVEICAELADVRAVYAFGSFAAGSVRIHSDLDILVVRDTRAPRAQRDTEIRIRFDVPVGLDLIVLTPAEFAERLPTTSFGRTILATAIRLDRADAAG